MPRKKSTTYRFGPGFSLRPNASGVYHIRVRDPNRSPVEKSMTLRTSSYPQAFRLADQKYREYCAGDWSPWDRYQGGRMVAEAIDAFIRSKRGTVRDNTLYTYECIIRLALPHARIPLEMVSPEQMKHFLYGKDLSQATRRSYWRTMQVFWNWCVEHGMCATSPLDKVRAPTNPDPIANAMTPHELDRILAAMEGYGDGSDNPTWLPDYVRFLAGTGMRPSEAANLKWDAVRDEYIIVRSRGRERTKTDRERLVPILEDVATLLSTLDRRCDYVLTNHGGRKRLTVWYCSKIFRMHRDKAGLNDYNLYSLRHYFIAELVRRGFNDRDIAYIVGHADRRTTERYGVFRKSEVVDRIRKMYREQDS